MYFYHVYGLNVESELELNVLQSASGKSDVYIRYGHIDNPPSLIDDEWSTYQATDNKFCITYRDIGAFLVRDGCEIIVDISNDEKLSEVPHILLGIAIAVILHQRGHVILHSSLVEVDGKAVGFLGNSGDGKSSMAMALYEHGYKLISDDLAVIDFNLADEIIVHQGFPQTKLWPDFAESIGIDAGSMQLIQSDSIKRVRRLYDRFTEKALIPLHTLYILDFDDEVDIVELKGHEALIGLVGYSYDINLSKMTDNLGRHMQQCKKIAEHISIKRLSRPYDLSEMPKIVQTIEHDIHSSN